MREQWKINFSFTTWKPCKRGKISDARVPQKPKSTHFFHCPQPSLRGPQSGGLTGPTLSGPVVRVSISFAVLDWPPRLIFPSLSSLDSSAQRITFPVHVRKTHPNHLALFELSHSSKDSTLGPSTYWFTTNDLSRSSNPVNHRPYFCVE